RGVNIFLVGLEALIRKYPDRETGYAIIPASYAGSVKKDCPEVEETVRVTNVNQGATLFRYEDRLFEERTVLNADSTFFKVFQIPVLKGDPEKCLAAPNSIVMTESTARRYFGEAEAVGKTIQRLDGQQNPQALTVTAVCADLPKDVHFTFDLLGTTSGVEFFNQPNHVSFSVYTYFLLKPGADSKALEPKFPGIVDKYAAGEIQRNFGVNYDEYRAAGNGYHYFLQPVQDIHLRSHLEYEALPTGSATMVYLFTVIAGFILLIACINFMNLATARSAERAREVGIRKTLGSERGQIAGQFLFEAILISLLAAVVGVGLAQGILPTFNQLADKQISLGQFISPVTVIGFLAFAVLTGLLAGSYPAAVLSGFNPIEVLKGKFTSHTKGVWLRNGLVVFQFAISICLIISTIVDFNQ
ncbi:MAG: FtsX-like permease family protein, partial [Bacteroidota bacterium]